MFSPPYRSILFFRPVKGEGFWIYGVNPVREALRAGLPVEDLLFCRQRMREEVTEILERCRRKGIEPKKIDRPSLDRLTHNAPHQGIAARLPSFPYRELEEVMEREGVPSFLVLDGIEDPRNLGAIIRTAEACGVWAVVIPERRAAPITGAVAKASAGALFHLPVVKVKNLGNAIRRLKGWGIWIIGASAEAPTSLYDGDLTVPLAIVIGGEGRGIRPLVKRECDMLLSIPMRGKVNSLNASVAASVILYEMTRQRSSSPEDDHPYLIDKRNGWK